MRLMYATYMPVKTDLGITFSKNLRRELKVRGLSVAELSLRSGVPAKTLYHWTSGQVPRHVVQVKSVADALGLTLDELLFGEAASSSLRTSLLEINFGNLARAQSEIWAKFAVATDRTLGLSQGSDKKV